MKKPSIRKTIDIIQLVILLVEIFRSKERKK